jgi:hypothetical protein
MRIEEIIKFYISPIPRLDGLGTKFTGTQAYDYFKRQAKFVEIEAFLNLRFERKFREVVETQEQQDQLSGLAKEIALLSQHYFDLKFPNYANSQTQE